MPFSLCSAALPLSPMHLALPVLQPPTPGLPFVFVLPYVTRPAVVQDSNEIARLATQLGYPASPQVMRARLARLIGSLNDLVLVAEATDQSALLGWVHGLLYQPLEADYRLEIAGLIVDERCHRHGVGRHLVTQLETWGLEHNAMQASVRCRTSRPEAHLFYQHLGYSHSKTQAVFRKPL